MLRRFCRQSRSKSGPVVTFVGIVGLALLLAACDFNAPVAIPTQVIVIPTSTLAPILTATPRLTATLIPTDTLIPSPTAPASNTPPPISATFTPSVSPTPSIMGVVRTDKGDVNLRTGPGLNFRKIGTLLAGSQVQVLFTNTDATWTLLQIQDGTQGWALSTLITYLNPSATVPALDTPQLTQQAQLATAISLTGTAVAPSNTAGVLSPAAGPTHIPQIVSNTDVLSYCDNPASNAPQNKRFAQGAPVVVFWSWIAQTPELIKDQLDNAQYNVTVDGQLISDWQNYASPVTALKKGGYIVYWFVPLGKPDVGIHHIVYKLTWKQPISDGVDSFGAGTANPANSGTCSFTVTPK